MAAQIAHTNRAIKAIQMELGFLVDSNLLDAEAYEKICALLPAPNSVLSNSNNFNNTSISSALAATRGLSDVAKQTGWGGAANKTGTTNNHTGAIAAAATTIVPTALGYQVQQKPLLPQRNKTASPAASYVPPPPPPAAPPVASSSEKSVPQPPSVPAVPPPPSYDSNQTIVRAEYPYESTNPQDLNFLKDEKIIVTSDSDQDWWSGRSVVTGKEGWFPRNRVVLVSEGEKKSKADDNMMTNVAYGHGSNSGFSSSHQDSEEKDKSKGKLAEGGKKFGSKLGNAAIFGAGATIGGKIVNGIF